MSRSHRFSNLPAPFVLALLVAFWVFLAPTQLGGPASYVIVNGNSMEPLYHRGDLVIVRATSDYRTGDIVTYRHPDIGPVIHRIIGRDGDRWVFKGDHNDFVDPYHPGQVDMIGRAWLYLPSAGKLLVQLRSPLAMALLALGAGGVIMITITGDAAGRGKRKRARSPAGAPPAARHAGGGREALLALLGMLALAALALAALAFTRPDTRDVPDEIAYQQSGEFSYSAAAPPGLYDAPTVQTGEPVFRKLTSALSAQFAYRFESPQAGDLHGAYRLVAELGALNGWKRTIELQSSQTFSGGAFTAHGVLDLGRVQVLIERLEQQTTLQRQQYTLAIVPELWVEGTLAGQARRDDFAPRLEFRLDELQMQLVKGDSDSKDPIKPSKSGLLKRMYTEPNTLALLGLVLDVPTARQVSLIGLALALVGAGAVGVPMLRAMRRDAAARIQLKYGALIVGVAGADRRADERAIEIATIEDLAKIAEKQGAMILHATDTTTDRYIVHDGIVSYCYQLAQSTGHQFAVSGTASEAPRPWSGGAADQRGAAVLGQFDSPVVWQAAFLAALHEQGLVSAACRAAGVEITAAYRERQRVPAFARAWDEVRAAVYHHTTSGS